MAVPDPTSRYAAVPAIDVPQPDGSTRRMGAPRVVPEPRLGGLYQARAATGDSTRWWVLADANPWSDATQLEQPGETIDLPDA